MLEKERVMPVRVSATVKKTVKKEKSSAKKPVVEPVANKGRRKGKTAQISRRLALDTVPDTRKTWARLIRLYDRNQISSAKARDLNSFIRTHLSLLQAEKDEDLLKRIEELEAKFTGFSVATQVGKTLAKR